MKRDRSGDLAATVAKFVCGSDVPTGATRERVAMVFVDTLSAMIAGATSDVLAPLRAYVSEQAITSEGKPVLGTSIRATAELAALCNGTIAAALEFDDVLSLMPAHPSAVVVAALLASDRALDGTGRDVLDAYAVGVEAGARIAQAMTLDHYKRGFHATGTLAVFSAVAALARLQGLDRPLFQRALGVAASMSSGIQGNFGTMTKPLHSGLAARNALAAVSLAQAGLTACESVFEAEGGYFSSYSSSNAHVDHITAPIASPWVFDRPGVTLKLFPCCYASHRGMDGLQTLMRDNAWQARDIISIRCKAPPGGLIPLKFPRPKSHFESLFSLPYALAVTALDGHPGLASFSESRVRADDVAEMLNRIEVVESTDCVTDYPDYDSKSYGSRGEIHLEVEASRARRASIRVHLAPGHPDRPMTWTQAEAKFIGCVHAADLSHLQVSEVFHTLRQLDGVPRLRDVVEQLTAPNTQQ